MDAARAAAETGLRARLYPSGEIEFSREVLPEGDLEDPTPEALLEGWLNDQRGQAR